MMILLNPFLHSSRILYIVCVYTVYNEVLWESKCSLLQDKQLLRTRCGSYKIGMEYHVPQVCLRIIVSALGVNAYSSLHILHLKWKGLGKVHLQSKAKNYLKIFIQNLTTELLKYGKVSVNVFFLIN